MITKKKKKKKGAVEYHEGKYLIVIIYENDVSSRWVILHLRAVSIPRRRTSPQNKDIFIFFIKGTILPSKRDDNFRVSLNPLRLPTAPPNINYELN